MAVEPPDPAGKIGGWLTAVKGLTITNALVIMLLVIVLVPAYLVYRATNDERLLDRFLSNYREISAQQSGCTERIAKQRGGQESWSVSTGFAFQGSDRWVISVWMDHEPSNDQIVSYCETLNLLVDFMRDPDAHSPTFPNSDKPVVKQYPRDRGDESSQ